MGGGAHGPVWCRGMAMSSSAVEHHMQGNNWGKLTLGLGTTRQKAWWGNQFRDSCNSSRLSFATEQIVHQQQVIESHRLVIPRERGDGRVVCGACCFVVLWGQDRTARGCGQATSNFTESGHRNSNVNDESSVTVCNSRTDQLSQAKITPVPSPTARGCHDR